jgi:TonB family protein
MEIKTALRLFVLACSVILLASAANAQEKSGTTEPSTATHGDDRSSTPWDPHSLRSQSGDPVYRVGSGVTPPHLIKSPDPKYTKAAKEAKIQGRVVLWLIVNAQGMAERVRIQKSLDPGLDRSAAETVSRWKFAPATKDGQPVAVMINVEVNFKLY